MGTVALVCAAATSVACGDDDSAEGTGGAGGTSGTGGAGGSGAGDACTSPDDTIAIDARYDTAGNIVTDGSGKTITEMATQCVACLSETGATRDTCIKDCYAGKTGGHVSDACMACAVISTTCSIDSNCTSKCLGPEGATAAECVACRCNAAGSGNNKNRNCVDEYEACAGIPSTTVCP